MAKDDARAGNAFGNSSAERSLNITARGVVSALVLAALIIFAAQNFEGVTISFLWLQFDGVPLWLVILGSAFLGTLLDGSVRSLVRYLRNKPPEE